MGYSAGIGLMNIWIDDLVPCLKDNETGDLKETFVYRIQSKSFLKHFRENNGWYINWDELPAGVEVYALALQEDANAVQGLIGIVNDQEAKAAYLHWGCTAPWNNKHDYGTQRYSGVGGHLFAIGAEKSMEWGYNGAMYAFAANEELLRHYIDKFGAVYIGIIRNYHFGIPEAQAQKIREVYRFEWI